MVIKFLATTVVSGILAVGLLMTGCTKDKMMMEDSMDSGMHKSMEKPMSDNMEKPMKDSMQDGM